jgi:hypothetical protein
MAEPKAMASRRGSSRKAPPGKTGARRTARVRPGSRSDLGAPIDGFFARHPPHLRVILEKLRGLVEEAVPDAESSLKWGMPWFTVEGRRMCALTGHKAHVNLVLCGRAEAFDDPQGRLAGSGEAGRHLKLTSLGDLPVRAVRRWLRTAAAEARKAR